jgi:homospermidine synthase
VSRYFNFDKEKFKLEKFREKARKFYDKNQILCSKRACNRFCVTAIS